MVSLSLTSMDGSYLDLDEIRVDSIHLPVPGDVIWVRGDGYVVVARTYCTVDDRLELTGLRVRREAS